MWILLLIKNATQGKSVRQLKSDVLASDLVTAPELVQITTSPLTNELFVCRFSHIYVILSVCIERSWPFINIYNLITIIHTFLIITIRRIWSLYDPSTSIQFLLRVSMIFFNAIWEKSVFDQVTPFKSCKNLSFGDFEKLRGFRLYSIINNKYLFFFQVENSVQICPFRLQFPAMFMYMCAL